MHVVISRKGEDSPVYEVKPETGPGRARILHRNLLLPCNHLPVDVASKTPHRQKPRKEIRRETNQAPTILVEESSDDESEHYELNSSNLNGNQNYKLTIPQRQSLRILPGNLRASQTEEREKMVARQMRSTPL